MKNKKVSKINTKFIGLIMLSISISLFAYSVILNNQKYSEAQEFVSQDTRSQIIPSATPTTKKVKPTGEVKLAKLPPKKKSLPNENKIIIPKIGVESIITEGQDSEEALREGVWRAGEFNTPAGNLIREDSPPIIMASHVYGYDNWTDDFRQKVSFRGLNNLSNGDKIELIWDQRKYIYEIKTGEVNTEISNYSDYDLILYTCEDLSGSENRVIKYAQLVNDIS